MKNPHILSFLRKRKKKMADIIQFKKHTFGRTPILVPVTEITRANLIDVLHRAIPIFEKNASECEYLYEYYKGNQPILARVKEIRPEICNTIVVNRAYEIVTFKTGRFLYKNIQYVNRSEKTTNAVNALNTYMYADNKCGKDRELVDWIHICGHGYRMAVDADASEGIPFHTYTIEPTRAFVVYADTVDRKPLMGVYYTYYLDKDETKHKVYTCYTDSMVYTFENDAITSETPHILGGVPIVEYPANYARLGCFEMVLELLDAINLATSNRQDGLEQFIQALLVLKNIDLAKDDITKLRREGAICIPEGSDVEYLVHELNQSQTQTLVDDLYQAVLTICGMPNRQKGATSTSDNKGAVVLRDGWSSSATAVKETKQYFESAERKMLNMVLKVFNVYEALETENYEPLSVSDIEVHFDEGEYENMLEKAQVLTMLLANDWVHPKDAYAFSNITPDPESAYLAGKQFHEEQEAKAVDDMMDDEDDNDVRVHGQNNDKSDEAVDSDIQ